jgi:hypothetical protein
MKKRFENIFIRELVDSEFAFAKTRTKTSGLNSLNSIINFKKSNQFQVLDLFELNTSLKQLIRILFSLKYSKFIYRSKFIIYIWCDNSFILELVESFIQEFRIAKYIRTCSSFPSTTHAKNTKKKQFLFVLGDPWLLQPKRMVDSYILRHEICFVGTLNFKNERHEPGFYKIQNDLSDYKKLIVILVIIESIINHKKIVIDKEVPEISKVNKK